MYTLKQKRSFILRSLWNKISKRSTHNVAPNHDLHYQSRLIQFNEKFPILKQQVLKRVKIQNVTKQFEHFIDYQVPCGHQIRAAIILNVLEAMDPLSRYFEANENQVSLAHVMAWIAEMHQAGIILTDDIIDESTSRRGKLPWHMKREKFAICDLVMLIASSNLLFVDYFRNTSIFEIAMKVIQEEFGLNVYSSEAQEIHCPGMIRKKTLNMEFYKRYTISKSEYTSTGSFKLAALMALNSKTDFGNVNHVLDEIAYFGGLLNDGKNFYKDTKSGKIMHADISEGKITWFLTYVMQNASQQDLNFIAINYGNKDRQHVDQIVNIYEKFHLKEKYDAILDEQINLIENKLHTIPNDKKLRDGLSKLFQIVLQYRSANPTKIN